MTQPEQDRSTTQEQPSASTAATAATPSQAAAADEATESAPETQHETIDPFLDGFVPAEASAAEASATEADTANEQPDTAERAPGSPNTDALPSAGDALAMLDGPSVATAGIAAPAVGPTTGAGDEDAALNAEPMSALEIQQLEERVIDAMRTIFDPEIPVNIYELGLIYELDIDPQGRAVVEMTLTSPACPVAGILPGEVEQKVLSVDGVNVAKVELVWDPPWSPDMMSEAAQLQLGFY